MRRGFAGALIVLAGASWWGCRTPTEITLTVTVQSPLVCQSLKGLRISVASDPQKAEDQLNSPVAQVGPEACANGSYGTLVITPGDSDRAAVAVLAGVDKPVEQCTAVDKYKGCIVVRRIVSFIDHVKLTLPAELQADCKDVSCEVVTTCRAGTCISSDYDCENGDTCTPTDPRALPDGGVDPDATLPDGSRPGEDAAHDASREDASTDGGAPDGPITVDGGECTAKCADDGIEPAFAKCVSPSPGCCYAYAAGTKSACLDPVTCKNNGSLWACCTSQSQCSTGLTCCYDSTTAQATCRTGCGGPTLFAVCKAPMPDPTCVPPRTCKPYGQTSFWACTP